MPNIKNALTRWRLLRNGGPWLHIDRTHRRDADRMMLAVAAYCVAWAACGYVLVEPKRLLNPYGVVYLAGAILTNLMACYAVARIANRTHAFTRFTAMYASILAFVLGCSVVAFTALHLTLGDFSYWGQTICAVGLAFILAAAYVAAVKTLSIGKLAPLFFALIPVAGIGAYGQLPAIPMWYTQPAQDANGATGRYEPISVEATYYDQYGLMDDAVDKLAKQRPGITDIYFVGFAAYASQDVFMKEVRSVGQLFDDRFDTTGRSMLLINNRASVRDTPLANGNNLWYGLRQIGRVLDPEEDVLFLFLTSHGSKDLLSIDFWPLQPDNMTAEDLRNTLDNSGIKWRVIVVSACYSGSFIDDLRTDHSLIITAAHADRTSFGCGNEFDFTYFGRAYFDQALRGTFSFIEAFGTASKAIEQRESEEGLTPSQPQIDIGSAIRPKLEEIGKRLLQLHKDQVADKQTPRPAAPAPVRGLPQQVRQ